MTKGFTRPRKEFEPYLRTQEAAGGSSQGLPCLHLFLSSVFLLEERRLGENGGGESSDDLVCGGDDESGHVQDVELTALSEERSCKAAS